MTEDGERQSRLRRLGKVAGLPVGIVLSTLLVWQSTHSAFNASTSNSGSAFSAGTVTMSDDDSGSALFSVTGLEPSDYGTNCIKVTYTGSLPSTVKLFIPAGGLTGSGLATYLDITIDEGTGATYNSCSGFVLGSTLYTGTLANFASTYTSSANGVSSWSATTGATKSYRISYVLQITNSAQNKNSAANLTWEASNT